MINRETILRHEDIADSDSGQAHDFMRMEPSRVRLSGRDFHQFCVGLEAGYRPNEALDRALTEAAKNVRQV